MTMKIIMQHVDILACMVAYHFSKYLNLEQKTLKGIRKRSKETINKAKYKA